MGTSVFPWTGLRQASKTLTNAQTLALPTTAIELVPAPGANKVLVPMCAWFQVTWVADYTNIGDTGSVAILAGTSLSALQSFREDVSGQVSSLLADGASHQCLMVPAVSGSVAGALARISSLGQFTDDPGQTNVALNLRATNSGSATGDYQDGNAGNTIRVTVLYLVYDMTSGMFV